MGTHEVKAALPSGAKVVLHQFKAGDWVIRETRRKH